MARPFQRILVGIDLSLAESTITRGSRLALDRARWLAERFEASVTLVHSTARDEHWDPGAHAFVLRDAGMGADGKRVLDSLLEELSGAGIRAQLQHSDEGAWLALVREALRWEADLVVLGKRTEAPEDGRKIGSVAKKVLRKAPCAVWLEDPRRQAPPHALVAATDLTEVGRRVLDVAATLSDQLDADLHVVHACSLPLEIQMGGDEARGRHERETRERANERIRAALEGRACEGRAQVHLGTTSPTRAILQVVAATNADLVVMGTVARGGIPGLLVGNTAERLFDLLDCSLLAVKPADFVCPVERVPAR